MFNYLRTNFPIILVVAVTAGAPLSAVKFPATVSAYGGRCETLECRNEVAAARIGTAVYHDINVALADGFAHISPCVRREGLAQWGFISEMLPDET